MTRAATVDAGWAAPPADPEIGALVRVRGQQWVVSRVYRSAQPVDELAAATLPGRTLVSLSSVSDDDLGRELTLVWEVEPGREVVPADRLPDLTDTSRPYDDPQRLGAVLDAVRWGTVASADETTLQAPFRSGITIEEYQLEPVARALTMPRVNLLVADDVGLGKTIEAGLVTQELLLRHRARRVLVVCPAPLTRKWRDEMAQKFGLDFVILDAQALRDLRRSHGLQANPFTVHPRTIISLPWLRTPRVRRLLDEVLTAETRQRGFFDLLIVDEAHHCAPPAPTRKGGYAVDSLQTQAVRHVSAHATHRLLLTATPHNGYSESWQALLEILDPRRFTRGVEPDPAVVAEVVVRRLKDDVVRPDGSPRFAGRLPPRAVPVHYDEHERRGHELLERYVTARRRAAKAGATRGHDLVLLLLKKRLFSSPAAFHRTLMAHAATLTGDRAAGDDELPDWLDEVLAWDDEELIDDESGQEAEAELLARVGGDAPEGEAAELLTELQAWAERAAEPADAKALALIEELRAVCKPDGAWTDERVIVFTEYRDTQLWLAGLLAASGRDLGGERLGLLYGGMDERKRERLKAAFQAAPDRDPVRILLATDSASEGIDLQRHCHRVISYDIPFNPNRLEQRIGRVDRHGQPHPVEVVHFVGAGWEDDATGSYRGDLEFLSRVAVKVATEREDIGRVNPILAAAVEARMLGRPSLADPFAVEQSPTRTMLRAERELRAQVARLRAQVDESRRRLHVGGANVRRVVQTALDLAEQPPLVDAEQPGVVEHPALRGGWERTVLDDVDPLSGEPLPLTFDAARAEGDDGVVLAHLEHPLVAQSTRLLRSAIWSDRTPLRRVAAVLAELPEEVGPDEVLVAAFARLVVVGGDGVRLHEEVLLSGRAVPSSGRSRRIELEEQRMRPFRDAVEGALEPDACRPAPNDATARVLTGWKDLRPLVADDLRRRAELAQSRLAARLTDRSEAEGERIRRVYEQLQVSLEQALADEGPRQLTLGDLQPRERAQVERDREAWQARLDGLPDEAEREVRNAQDRYATVQQLVFPFAVVLCVPTGASR